MAVSEARPVTIFISYRRADASWPARWLADELAGQFGAGVVFQDVDSIRPGDDFAAEIEAAVGACSVLLAVIGPRWLTSAGNQGRRLDDPGDWVRLEIETAIKRGIRIIPVLVDGAGMPPAGALPLSLRGLARRQAVTLNPASLDTRRLVSALEAAIAQQGERAAQPDGSTPGSEQPGGSRASLMMMSAIPLSSLRNVWHGWLPRQKPQRARSTTGHGKCWHCPRSPRPWRRSIPNGARPSPALSKNRACVRLR
jgi:hypothetical protein